MQSTHSAFDEARGRKRFKGIADPVAVYRAVRDGVLPPRRRRISWPLMLAGASALAGVVLVGRSSAAP